MGWLENALRRRGTVFVMAVAPGAAVASVDGSHIAALPNEPGPRGERTAEQAEIEREPVCVGSSVKSAGDLSDVLYYRAVALPDGRVEVGYFAFYSEERPWGNNWLTWSVVPALAVDLVYSRALLVAPGLQRALYGAGDVEGVGVVYDRLADGSLRFDVSGRSAVVPVDAERSSHRLREGTYRALPVAALVSEVRTLVGAAPAELMAPHLAVEGGTIVIDRERLLSRESNGRVRRVIG